jgi:hypothetical protein
LIEILHNEFPQIEKHCVLITDCDVDLKKAFRVYYPQLEQLRCWIYLINDVRIAVKKYYLPLQQMTDGEKKDLRKKNKEIMNNLIGSITNLLRASSKLQFIIILLNYGRRSFVIGLTTIFCQQLMN